MTRAAFAARSGSIPSLVSLLRTGTDVSRFGLSRPRIVDNVTVSNCGAVKKPSKNQPHALNLFVLR
jgi:hypothetical protein